MQRQAGNIAAAEESYRKAAESGYEPQPGLALLTLARGDAVQAQSMIRTSSASIASHSSGSVARRNRLRTRPSVRLKLAHTFGRSALRCR